MDLPIGQLQPQPGPPVTALANTDQFAIQSPDGKTRRAFINSATFKRFNPTDYGALPSNSAADNTTAFQAAAAALQANNGGVFELDPFTYTVGHQVFANGFGHGYAYQGSIVIDISGCTNPVIIEGNGAILNMVSGLKFGSFNPSTGAPFIPGLLPFVNVDYQARTGTVLQITDNAMVSIKDLIINGNNTNAVIGGQWGDTGYQIPYSDGIHLVNNDFLKLENVYTHHNCLDNLYITYAGLTAGSDIIPVTLINVKSEYAARQALSWLGGNNMTAISCAFNYTGQAINLGTSAKLSSAPGAGIDFETDPSTILRGGTFINCQFGANAGNGVNADGDATISSDMHFIDCEFYGVFNYSTWTSNPRYKFTNCLLAGEAIHAYISPNQADRTTFNQCIFSADRTFDGVAAKFGTSLYDFTFENPFFNTCSFVTTQSSVVAGISQSSVFPTYYNCTFKQNGSSGTCYPRGTWIGDLNSITMTTGSANLDFSTVYDQIAVSGSILGIANNGSVVYANHFPRAASFVPADASGASLTLINPIGTYSVINGSSVDFFISVQYPSTASGSFVAISGLPIPVLFRNLSSALIISSTLPVTGYLDPGSPTTIFLVNSSTNAQITNAQMSLHTLNITGSYAI